ncbi:MAG: helix-turn-helix transcriptional regulator [Planctomycetes bacterium]|nr:helix-turn-helix transcriptional regulator [Planctomycetota bacterium]
MKDEDRYKLYFGPYNPPRVRRGWRLFDEIHGTVVTGYFSDGLITWPTVGIRGRRSLVLCGDLVKAVRRESAPAVSHWWGVSISVVSRWRKALGVPRLNEGTRLLLKARWKELAPLRVWEKAIRKASDPVMRTRQARRRRRLGLPARKNVRQWTPQEDALLGTMKDRQLGQKLGCTVAVIARRRLSLGIPPFRKTNFHVGLPTISPAKLWARRKALRLNQATVAKRSGISQYSNLELGIQRHLPPETIERLAIALCCRKEDILLKHAPVQRAVPDDSLLGKMPDGKLAKKWGISIDRVNWHRKRLGIPSFRSQYAKIPDKSLLGTIPDTELAKKWRVPTLRVCRWRARLGIPAFEPYPKVPDDSLLGTQSDWKLAKKWGISVHTVIGRRQRLKILSFKSQRSKIPDESLLGTEMDKVLAKKWGLTWAIVQQRRLKLGIPSYKSSHQPHIPDKLLGTMSDEALAAKLGLASSGSVSWRRKKLGVPSFIDSNRVVISPGKLLACRKHAGLTQKQVATRAGLSLSFYCVMERGRRKMTLKSSAERFARVLHCRVEDFARPLLAGRTKRS